MAIKSAINAKKETILQQIILNLQKTSVNLSNFYTGN